MKKIFIALVAAAFAFTSCEEWDPVLTGKYDDPGTYQTVTMTPNTTIAALKAMYKGSPLKIQNDVLIGGQVISSDRSGNIYRSLYIQDETGAIEVKIGKSGLYNDYKLGQWVYVNCNGLSLGNYNGMVQLGYEDPTASYETAYIDVQSIIDSHIWRGEIASAPSAKVLSEADLTKAENFGRYVELDGLSYGHLPQYKDSSKAIFCLIYVDPSKDTKDNSNRLFLSGRTWGVTTWAMSKEKEIAYLKSGVWDSASTNGKASVPSIKSTLIANAQAYAVSQYFLMGNSEVQIRTSGYARFADTEIDPDVRHGKARINVKGILTSYNGAVQFTLLDLEPEHYTVVK